jgi:hypothetical protein
MAGGNLFSILVVGYMAQNFNGFNIEHIQALNKLFTHLFD